MTAYRVDRNRSEHDLASGIVCDLSGIKAALENSPS